MVKNPPAMQETRVQSLGREDPLEEEMATHSSILAWESSWIEKPGGHSGGFIYSKSAGEPLKDSAQSSELMELLFLKTQWLMCGEQVNSHRSRKVSESGE